MVQALPHTVPPSRCIRQRLHIHWSTIVFQGTPGEGSISLSAPPSTQANPSDSLSSFKSANSPLRSLIGSSSRDRYLFRVCRTPWVSIYSPSPLFSMVFIKDTARVWLANWGRAVYWTIELSLDSHGNCSVSSNGALPDHGSAKFVIA